MIWFSFFGLIVLNLNPTEGCFEVGVTPFQEGFGLKRNDLVRDDTTSFQVDFVNRRHIIAEGILETITIWEFVYY